MKLAVTGFPGGLLRDRLCNLGCSPINVDITSEEAVCKELDEVQPNVLIHAAAMTSVDGCENNQHKAFDVNVSATLRIASNCQLRGIHLIYLSTCHVFDGTALLPYTEISNPNPRNVYGFTKWLGEEAARNFNVNTTIIRVSKLFSLSDFDSYKVAGEFDRPTFIVRNYIHVDAFCTALMEVSNRPKKFPKVLNISGFGAYSDAMFYAQAIEYLHYPAVIVPRTVEHPGIPRPYMGILDVNKAMSKGIICPTLDESLELLYKERSK